MRLPLTLMELKKSKSALMVQYRSSGGIRDPLTHQRPQAVLAKLELRSISLVKSRQQLRKTHHLQDALGLCMHCLHQRS